MANKCNCPHHRAQRVIRRGDKKEMRALIRELDNMLGFFEDELEDAQHFIHHLTHDVDDEVTETKNYVN